MIVKETARVRLHVFSRVCTCVNKDQRGIYIYNIYFIFLFNYILRRETPNKIDWKIILYWFDIVERNKRIFIFENK